MKGLNFRIKGSTNEELSFEKYQTKENIDPDNENKATDNKNTSLQFYKNLKLFVLKENVSIITMIDNLTKSCYKDNHLIEENIEDKFLA